MIPNRRRDYDAASMRLAVLSIAILAAGCSASRSLAPPGAPPALKVPPNERLSLEAFASGVQIYECAATRQWVFKAPQAELADRDGKKIGTHYAGPTWEADDGSKVVGREKARENGRSAGDLPWLLLAATSATGGGTLGRTQSIQRMDTAGGMPPAGACAPGDVARVPYRATYYFYRRR